MRRINVNRAVDELGMARGNSKTPSALPTIFPGQSLAHNLHEFVLGVLINSEGQRVLSKQVLSISRPKRPTKRLQNADSDTPSSSHSRRTVVSIDRFDRIPTWPTANGLRWKAIGQFNPDLAARLEHQFGGADCPNLWLEESYSANTSPFLMLCHHNHSFRLDDPVRLLEKQIIPEGFPSHGHRGMTTVTICLRGGLIHRDSHGTKQVFGADEKSSSLVSRKPYNGKHTQWVSFGRGLIHELMWDNSRKEGVAGRRDGNIVHQELYQIWVDLPKNKRYMEPRVELLGDEESPTVIENGCKTTVIAGEFNGLAKASVDTVSDLSIFTVQIKSGKTWTYSPPKSFSTMIIYARLGSVLIGKSRVPAHCTAYLSKSGETVSIQSENEAAEVLVMAGQSLGQHVVAKGSMVAESSDELKCAFVDYAGGRLGVPWSETYSDDEWREHLKQHAQL